MNINYYHYRLIFLIVSTVTSIHSMEIEKNNNDQLSILEKDPRLLCGLPDDLLPIIIRYARSNTFEDIGWLIQCSRICKKYIYLNEPKNIRTTLDLSQKELDLYLLYFSRFARSRHPIACITLLLALGANIDASSHGMIPSDYSGNEYFKRLYLHADVQEQDTIGKTPLYWAIKLGSINVVKLLLEHNATINVQDRNNYSLMDLAMIWNRPKSIKLLIEYGANTSCEHNLGSFNITIQDWAFINDQEDIYTLVTGNKMPQCFPWYIDLACTMLNDLKSQCTIS
jgi:hypothetical protein